MPVTYTPYPKDLNLNKQDIPIPGSETATTSASYVTTTFDPSLIQVDLNGNPRPKTLYEIFENTANEFPNVPIFRSRVLLKPTKAGEAPAVGNETVDTTYGEVQHRRNALGSALLALERLGRLRNPNAPAGQQSPPEIVYEGLPAWGDRLKGGARRGWAVGVWSRNREEWQVVDLACQAYGLVGVSLYETLGPNTTEFITNHCPVPIIFASSNHLVDILKIAPRCPSLRAVVSMDRLSSGERDVLSQWSTSLGILLLDMADLEEWGLEPGNYLAPGPLEGERELDSNRIATISYTSGTTGNPKGVILTNWNMTSATLSQSLGGVEFFTKPGWRFMSYLPLSHIYERFLQILVISGAGTICFSCGDTTKLLEDAQVFKPHFFPGVPRVWNRVHAAIQTQMDTPGLKGALLRQAIAAKRANWREHGQVTHRVYDALVFSKVRALLGGQVRYMSSGSAPLSGAVHELLKLCFSCDVVQGYGLTETVGTCSKGIAWDVGATGTCGHLTNCNEVMLADVAEMGYTHKDSPNPRGEVCIRGDNIFIGYLHDPENTSKALDKDGWFHTGDIGEFDSAGRLKIIDRVKNVVKLSQGEYVALEKLEGIYALNPLFAALLVHADSLRSSLVAIAVLDPALASKLVFDVLGEKIAPEDIKALDKAVQNEKIRDKIVAGFAQVAKKNKLNGFEHIRGVFPTVQPFEDDLMTPTQKVKRNVAAKFFAKEIDEIYNKTEGKISKL